MMFKLQTCKNAKNQSIILNRDTRDTINVCLTHIVIVWQLDILVFLP